VAVFDGGINDAPNKNQLFFSECQSFKDTCLLLGIRILVVCHYLKDVGNWLELVVLGLTYHEIFPIIPLNYGGAAGRVDCVDSEASVGAPPLVDQPLLDGLKSPKADTTPT